jgi:hypothetical protein
MMIISLQLLVGCSVLLSTQAFVVLPTNSIASLQSSSSSPLHVTKKRRRKRTDEPNSNESSSSFTSGGNDLSDLPDFDLGEDDQDSDKATTTPSKKPKRKNPTNPDEITVNMMGSFNQQAVRSIDELLRDRSLERKFEFDEPIDESLPDLADMARAGPAVSRKEQRRQAAVARDAAKPVESEPLQLPFEMTNSKGEIQFNKVLEAGAWLGIFLLIGWEVYINSPLFERAAPMAPIVYDTPP